MNDATARMKEWTNVTTRFIALLYRMYEMSLKYSLSIVYPLLGTNDVGEKYHDNILWACVQRGGGAIGSVDPQRQL